MANQDQAMVFSGPEETNYFRFASVKTQLKMEKVGIKSSGGPLRPRLAAEFGLKPRDSHDKYIAYCQQKLDEGVAAKTAALQAAATTKR